MAKDYGLRVNGYGMRSAHELKKNGAPGSAAQPLARNEPYGCGVPLAGTCPTHDLSFFAVGGLIAARWEAVLSLAGG